jgi:hypothetical protein
MLENRTQIKAIFNDISSLAKVCESKAVQEFTLADKLKGIKKLLGLDSENLSRAARAINRLFCECQDYQYACAVLRNALHKIFLSLCELLPEDSLQLDLFDIEEYHQEPKRHKPATLGRRLVKAIRHSWESAVKSRQLTLADAREVTGALIALEVKY